MSIIYTCNRNGVNPYDYLNALQRHGQEVKAKPEYWLPWNYVQTIAGISITEAA
jgi:hypothetical protein